MKKMNCKIEEDKIEQQMIRAYQEGMVAFKKSIVHRY